MLRDARPWRTQPTRTFYHHFESKEELLLLIHDKFVDEGLERARAIWNSNMSPPNKLDALISELVTDIAKFQAPETIFFENQRFLSEARFADIKAKRDEYERHVIDILEEGIASGDFRATASTRVLAYGIIGMGSWPYRWYRPESGLTAVQIAEVYSTVLLKGLECE